MLWIYVLQHRLFRCETYLTRLCLTYAVSAEKELSPLYMFSYNCLINTKKVVYVRRKCDICIILWGEVLVIEYKI